MSPKNAKQIYDIKPIKKKHRNKNLKNNDNIKKTPYNRLLTGRTSGGYQSIIWRPKWHPNVFDIDNRDLIGRQFYIKHPTQRIWTELDNGPTLSETLIFENLRSGISVE